MEMTQYQRDLVRMWDSMRKSNKGATRCVDVNCEVCPLHVCCRDEHGNLLFAAEKTIEIVNSWAKEHPFDTMAEKYEGVFGIKPIDKKGNYICPHNIGFLDVPCEDNYSCESCSSKFWNSEYKEPRGVSE